MIDSMPLSYSESIVEITTLTSDMPRNSIANLWKSKPATFRRVYWPERTIIPYRYN